VIAYLRQDTTVLKAIETEIQNQYKIAGDSMLVGLNTNAIGAATIANYLSEFLTKLSSP
jgi:hypothetical protein